jgi:hypothetical protein
MQAGPHPSQQLESQFRSPRNPLQRFHPPEYRSNKLYEVLGKKFPTLPFELAFVYFPRHTEFRHEKVPFADDRIHLFPIEQTTLAWEGDNHVWDAIFDTFDVEICSTGEASQPETHY